MTYGVDQCRVCGLAIEPYSRNTLEQYNVSTRTPTMPEAEWRRLGFLAMPTKEQIRHPALGCCARCGQKQLNKQWNPSKRTWMVLALIVSFATLVTYVDSFARH
jgi:hypothetical protein